MTAAEPSLPPEVLSFVRTDDRVQRCPADEDYARAVLERLIENESEDVLHAAAQGRWVKANTYAYDGARKAIEAWLLAHGWRIRATAGAHAAVVEVVDRWLSSAEDPGPRIARSFGAARKARHDDEYPSPTAPERTARELRALVLDSVRLLNVVRAELDLEIVEAVLPTDSVLEERPEH